jgi:ATP-dependent Zn protease
MEMTSREITSLHEAGHAIIALSLRVRVLYVTCEGTDRRFGTCKCGAKYQKHHYAALIARGGVLAETLAGRNARMEGTDRRIVERADKKCTRCTPELHDAQARRILQSNAQSLRLLARELFRRGTLTGKDIAALKLPIDKGGK